MFLSKCELNSARRGTMRLLGSPQMMHAAVESSFPSIDLYAGEDGKDSEKSRVLWRVDTGEHHPMLYVVSPEQPDFTHIVEQAGWPTQPRWGVADYAPLLDDLQAGQLWQFRLAANPVHNAPRADGKRGKRYAHVTAAQQEQWLAKRAAGMGISFDAAPEGTGDGPTGPAMFRVEERTMMRFKRKNRTVTVSKVRYDGVLRVADPDALKKTLVTGVGAAKAYGCGLLTLAPVPASGG